MLENRFFREFISKLNPSYVIPSALDLDSLRMSNEKIFCDFSDDELIRCRDETEIAIRDSEFVILSVFSFR